MTISIVPHAASHRDAVHDFNLRMRAGGQRYGFYVDPVPGWLPRRSPDAPAWREFHLAVDEGGAVRGAIALKPQRWTIDGVTHLVTDWQGPFSEGAVAPRYGSIALRMLREMVRRRPLLYSWGHGGEGEAIVRLLRRLEWRMHPTPWMVRVVDPARFARRNAALRRTPWARRALDLAAQTGAASAVVHAAHGLMRLRSMRRLDADAEVVASLGPWADEVWARGLPDHGALAIRDAAAVNTLFPPGAVNVEWSSPTRLRVSRGGRDLGWILVSLRAMDQHPLYGTLRVGTLVDYFGPVGEAARIVHAGFDWLRREGADLVMANQSDPRWIRALEDAGFVAVEGRRLFCAAPPLAALLSPFDRAKERLFLTNADGHGPMGL